MSEESQLTPGKCYLFQTCTKDWLGRLVSVDGPYAVRITEASWVADSGRLAEFLREGRSAQMEIEPIPNGLTVGLLWVNWIEWPHALLRETV